MAGMPHLNMCNAVAFHTKPNDRVATCHNQYDLVLICPLKVKWLSTPGFSLSLLTMASCAPRIDLYTSLHMQIRTLPCAPAHAGMNGTSDVEARLESLPLIGRKEDGWNLRGSFSASLGVLIAVLLTLFSLLVEYSTKNASDKAVLQHYTW